MKVFTALVIILLAIILAVLFTNIGTRVTGGEVHKCSTSTNINDLFCKEDK